MEHQTYVIALLLGRAAPMPLQQLAEPLTQSS
jgi:hypothetical protein